MVSRRNAGHPADLCRSLLVCALLTGSLPGRICGGLRPGLQRPTDKVLISQTNYPGS